MLLRIWGGGPDLAPAVILTSWVVCSLSVWCRLLLVCLPYLHPPPFCTILGTAEHRGPDPDICVSATPIIAAQQRTKPPADRTAASRAELPRGTCSTNCPRGAGTCPAPWRCHAPRSASRSRLARRHRPAVLRLRRNAQCLASPSSSHVRGIPVSRGSSHAVLCSRSGDVVRVRSHLCLVWPVQAFGARTPGSRRRRRAARARRTPRSGTGGCRRRYRL